WSASASDAEAQIAAAASLLAETEGEVADDAVRTAVGDAVAVAADALATASDAGPDGPSAREVAAVSSATSTLRAATGALSAAHQEWLAARAAAARPAPSTGGYAGDCGGPGSYQAPRSSSGTRFYTSVPAESGDGSNGNLPRSAMTPLSWCVDSAGNEQWLRSDAAAALVRMNEAFRTAFGENIAIDLSYRSYDDQVLAKQLFGRLAATPGTSNHGWGTAFDTWEWPAYDFGSERYTWLVENGPGYGGYCPAATEPGNPEYWHYEFRGRPPPP
ncbi:MAG TPA: M15 family metallopeptidase, partial [Actinotalea sp.]|nr:M15 family metallopeptidase [Actinotalea sp.]